MSVFKRLSQFSARKFFCFLNPRLAPARSSRAHTRRPALPIEPRSGRRILDHPELAFPGLAPLNHEMQDSTYLENLEANVAECGFGGGGACRRWSFCLSNINVVCI
jgi:hypothetical protein